MDSNTIKLFLSEVGPKRLTQKYDYIKACEDLHKINAIMQKEFFRTVSFNGNVFYKIHYDRKSFRGEGIPYTNRKFYEHLSSNGKEHMEKIYSLTKIHKYSDYLYNYYEAEFGENMLGEFYFKSMQGDDRYWGEDEEGYESQDDP